MVRNSSNDEVMIAAAEKMRMLLKRAADAATRARDVYHADPRWCGLPDKDASYPMCYQVNNWIGDDHNWIGDDHQSVSNEQEAIAYHKDMIEVIIKMFNGGLPNFETRWDQGSRNWIAVDCDQDESPRMYLDRVRGILRYAHRLDQRNSMTVAFALLSHKRTRRKRSSVITEYVPIPIEQSEMIPGIVELSQAIKEAFDHAAISLMPKTLTKRQADFIKWMASNGGCHRMRDIIKWVEVDKAHGRSNKGQGPERTLARMFCEKIGNRNSRTAYRLRPEAYDLLGLLSF